MVNKNYIFILFSIFSTFTYAQNTQVVPKQPDLYYLKKDSLSANNDVGIPAESKEAADSYRIVLPDSTDKLKFVVQDYYLNGKTKMVATSTVNSPFVKLEGPCVGFFENGKRKFIENFKDGRPIGNIIKYYPAGKLYMTAYIDDQSKYVLKRCYDTTGTVLADNGIGHWIKFDEYFKKVTGEGEIFNGLEQGQWKGRLNDSVTYVCEYDKSEVVSGMSLEKSGMQHPFKALHKDAEFKGGLEELGNFLARNIRYPVTARNNNVQGKVFVTFVVEVNGTLSNLKVLRGIGSGCDEETIRVLKLSSGSWKAGTEFGLPARTQFTVPVSYALQEDNISDFERISTKKYVNKVGEEVNVQKADYIRMVTPLSHAVHLFGITELYKNDKIKLITTSVSKDYLIANGEQREYYENGNKKGVSEYHFGKRIGNALEYFPNGLLQSKISYDEKGQTHLNECRDSSGAAVTEFGKGKWLKYDISGKAIVLEGRVENGVEVGEWHGTTEDGVTYTCKYDNGVLKSGVSKDIQGKIYEFNQLETAPEPIEGISSLVNNIKYPALAQKNNIQGRVFIGFYVDTNGKIVDIDDLQGIGTGCDEAVIATLKNSSKWKPATRYGITVGKYVILPILFTITDSGTKISLDKI